MALTTVTIAASGDLRNVGKTVVDLPDCYAQPVKVVINDLEFEVVARNTVWLLFALNLLLDQSSGEDSAIERVAQSLIHLWYSAFVQPHTIDELRDRVGSLISEVCTEITNKQASALHTKTWDFDSATSLTVTLTKKEWLKLEKITAAPKGLTYEEASRIRQKVTLAPERADYRDRWSFNEATPSARLVSQRFREDGLLLPFGDCRLGFTEPNP